MLLETLPVWLVYLLMVLILILDAVTVIAIVLLGVLFVGFRFGKYLYGLIQKEIDQIIYRILCVLEDLIESPQFEHASGFLVLVLFGVKTAYEVLNTFQNLIEFVITTLISIALLLAGAFCLVLLVVANMFLAWLIRYYMF